MRKSKIKTNSKTPEQILLNPEKIGMLVREIKAHNAVVNDLTKYEFSDCSGFVSVSKDSRVLTWSMNLDVYGKLTQDSTEVPDNQWNFPTNEKYNKELREI